MVKFTYIPEEQIIQKLLEHDEKFEKLDDKFEDFRRENLQKQDEMITILKKFDEERIFTIEWIKIENCFNA